MDVQGKNKNIKKLYSDVIIYHATFAHQSKVSKMLDLDL